MKNINVVNVADAKIGANGYPNKENTTVDRYTNVGKVVPKVKSVLLLTSKSKRAFSARNKDSECSKPVLCKTHERIK